MQSKKISGKNKNKSLMVLLVIFLALLLPFLILASSQNNDSRNMAAGKPEKKSEQKKKDSKKNSLECKAYPDSSVGCAGKTPGDVCPLKLNTGDAICTKKGKPDDNGMVNCSCTPKKGACKAEGGVCIDGNTCSSKGKTPVLGGGGCGENQVCCAGPCTGKKLGERCTTNNGKNGICSLQPGPFTDVSFDCVVADNNSGNPCNGKPIGSNCVTANGKSGSCVTVSNFSGTTVVCLRANDPVGACVNKDEGDDCNLPLGGICKWVTPSGTQDAKLKCVKNGTCTNENDTCTTAAGISGLCKYVTPEGTRDTRLLCVKNRNVEAR